MAVSEGIRGRFPFEVSVQPVCVPSMTRALCSLVTVLLHSGLPHHIYPFIAPNFCIASSTLYYWQLHPKKTLQHKCQHVCLF